LLGLLEWDTLYTSICVEYSLNVVNRYVQGIFDTKIKRCDKVFLECAGGNLWHMMERGVVLWIGLNDGG